MEKDTHITEMMFRVDKTKDFKGTVFAIMPYVIETTQGHVMTYQHVGQHSAGNFNHMIATSKPATETEYADLKAELENQFGYNIKVVMKRNYKRFLAAYKNIR